MLRIRLVRYTIYKEYLTCFIIKLTNSIGLQTVNVLAVFLVIGYYCAIMLMCFELEMYVGGVEYSLRLTEMRM